jgi:hypothetical protein
MARRRVHRDLDKIDPAEVWDLHAHGPKPTVDPLQALIDAEELGSWNGRGKAPRMGLVLGVTLDSPRRADGACPACSDRARFVLWYCERCGASYFDGVLPARPRAPLEDRVKRRREWKGSSGLAGGTGQPAA